MSDSVTQSDCNSTHYIVTRAAMSFSCDRTPRWLLAFRQSVDEHICSSRVIATAPPGEEPRHLVMLPSTPPSRSYSQQHCGLVSKNAQMAADADYD